MNKQLTPKQEKYAQLRILGGLTITDAYREAYDWTGGIDGLYVAASNIESHDKVAIRMEELAEKKNDKLVDNSVADLHERLQNASSILRSDTSRDRDKLVASRLLGDYQGDFSNTTNSDTTNIAINIFESIDSDTLGRLLAFIQVPGALEAWMASRHNVKDIGGHIIS